MAKKTKTPVPLKGGLESIRHDIATGRLPEASYIHRTNVPILNDKEKWVRQAHENGVSLPDLIRGSGLPVITIYKLLGLDPTDNRDKYEELCKLRTNIILRSNRK